MVRADDETPTSDKAPGLSHELSRGGKIAKAVAIGDGLSVEDCGQRGHDGPPRGLS